MSYAERLARRVAANEGRSEISYQCLCCKDQALISRFTVREYLLDTLSGELREEYEELLFPDRPILASVNQVPILCTRPGCNANMVTVDSADGNGRKKVYRYNPEFLVLADSRHCQYIHEQEIAKLRNAATPLPAPETRNAIEAVGRWV